MALIFLDASVLIAVLDGADPHHARVTATLSEEFAEDEWTTDAICAAEVLVGAYAADDQAAAVAEDLLHTGLDRIEPVGFEEARAAARLRAGRRSLGLPDAFHLAAAERLGADVILTTDRHWRRFGPRVRVL